MRCSGVPDTLFIVFSFQCVLDSRLYKKEYHKSTDKSTPKGNNCNKNLLYIKEIALERMHPSSAIKKFMSSDYFSSFPHFLQNFTPSSCFAPQYGQNDGFKSSAF